MTITLALTDWQIRRLGEPTGRPIGVPGCWKDAGYRTDDPGPPIVGTDVNQR